jgi:hypothetical protein
MLPCFVTDLFLNNQPDALIIQNLFRYKILHVLGIFSVHHQEFSTVHSALVSFMQVFDDRFQASQGGPDSAYMFTERSILKKEGDSMLLQNSCCFFME